MQASLEFLLVALPLFSGIAVTAAFGMAAMTSPRWSAVRGCFWASALTFGLLGVVWAAMPATVDYTRIGIAGLIGAVAAIGLALALSWAKSHETQLTEGTMVDEKPSDGDRFKNEGQGPQYNAPRGKIIINPPSPQPQPIPLPEVITQAGVVVGKTFGARHTPNDATLFEFTEITQAQQFNTKEPFEYQGTKLLFQSCKIRAGSMLTRPQDGMVFGGVIAKVLDR